MENQGKNLVFKEKAMENQRKNFVFHTKSFGKQRNTQFLKKKPWKTKEKI